MMLLNPYRFSAGGGGGGISARYWRAHIKVAQGGAAYGALAELYLVAGGVDIVTSGKTYTRSSQLNTSYPASAIYDGSSGNPYWAVTVANVPAWSAVDFGEPVTVDSAGAVVSTGAAASEIPNELWVEYSDDGVSWSLAGALSGQSSATWPLGTRKAIEFQ